MRRAWSRALGALVVLAYLAGTSGCTHYHIYGNQVPVCEAPAAVAAQPRLVHQYGAVCELPPAGAAPALVTGLPGSGPVLVSQPQGPLRLFGGGSRFAWRRPDPQSIATTRVDGNIDDSTVR